MSATVWRYQTNTTQSDQGSWRPRGLTGPGRGPLSPFPFRWRLGEDLTQDLLLKYRR